jgi:TPR repeat protein
MGRTALFALLAMWFLTTGSSCQTTVNGGRTTIVASDAAAAAGVGVSLVGVGIYCIAYTDECFPDEEALKAQADAYERARQTFTAGLRRYRDGDPTGLEWICLSAHQGYARAQYFYGSYLYRQGTEQRDESVMWLSQAAAQGHPEAGVMLRQVAGEAAPAGPSVDGAPEMVGPPPVRACAAEPSPPRHAALAKGSR